MADTGTFSAAAKRLRRAQSAVSHAIATLEAQVQVSLFDRTQRRPRLTPAGRELLGRARTVVEDLNQFRLRATELGGGARPEVALAIDAAYPMDALMQVLQRFRDANPGVGLRLYVENLGAVVQRVADGTCEVGMSLQLPTFPPGLVVKQIAAMDMVPAVARTHPLAHAPQPLSIATLREHVQIVLTDRSPLTEGMQFGVAGGKAWYVADLSAKMAMVRAGFGFGALPKHLVQAYLVSGEMVALTGEQWPKVIPPVPFLLVHREADPPGQAAQWLMDHLATACGSEHHGG